MADHKYREGIDELLKAASYKNVHEFLKCHMTEAQIREWQWANRNREPHGAFMKLPDAIRWSAWELYQDYQAKLQRWERLLRQRKIEEAQDKKALIIAALERLGGSASVTELCNTLTWQDWEWKPDAETLQALPEMDVVRKGAGHRIFLVTSGVRDG